MKSNGFLIAGVVVAGILLMSMSGNAVDLSYLTASYDAADVARLQRAANALASQGISGDLLNYCLAQVLQETGIFTNGYQNYTATDTRNNFSGITNSDGSYRVYNSANDWAADYVAILNHGPNYPADAVSISDFNNRLKANNYYTDSAATYGANLNYYYNILTQQ